MDTFNKKMERLIAAINSNNFPIYNGGDQFFKPTLEITNDDMTKLHSFFFPEPHVFQISGFISLSGFNVPTFLAELGYEVNLDEDERDMWTAKIPSNNLKI